MVFYQPGMMLSTKKQLFRIFCLFDHMKWTPLSVSLNLFPHSVTSLKLNCSPLRLSSRYVCLDKLVTSNTCLTSFYWSAPRQDVKPCVVMHPSGPSGQYPCRARGGGGKPKLSYLHTILLHIMVTTIIIRSYHTLINKCDNQIYQENNLHVNTC